MCPSTVEPTTIDRRRFKQRAVSTRKFICCFAWHFSSLIIFSFGGERGEVLWQFIFSLELQSCARDVLTNDRRYSCCARLQQQPSHPLFDSFRHGINSLESIFHVNDENGQRSLHTSRFYYYFFFVNNTSLLCTISQQQLSSMKLSTSRSPAVRLGSEGENRETNIYKISIANTEFLMLFSCCLTRSESRSKIFLVLCLLIQFMDGWGWSKREK